MAWWCGQSACTIAAESSLPETVRQNDNSIAVREVFAGNKGAAQQRFHAEDIEVRFVQTEPFVFPRGVPAFELYHQLDPFRRSRRFPYIPAASVARP